MNLQVFLCALALVESGNDDSAYNRDSGARGAFQITAKVWRQHSKYGFKAWSCQHFQSEFVASQHVRWLKDQGIPDQPWDMAYAWRHGPSGWKRRKHGADPAIHQWCSCHACRVERIYREAMYDPTVLKPAKKARAR